MVTTPPRDSLSAFNYCACFLDILGQRAALHGQGLLPVIATDEERIRFLQEVLTKTIRPITRLQKLAAEFIDVFQSRGESPIRATLAPELREEFDKIQGHEVRVQYWSDGLVAFSCLGNQAATQQINGAFALLGMAGSLCFMNLGRQFANPIRGGIDIAWGTELRPGELYGPAIARSYELESEVAQYPRIAVGERMFEFLKAVANLPSTDNFNRYSSTLAEVCLKMLIHDVDGQMIIHYLGQTFRDAINRSEHDAMYRDALEFIAQEYKRFRREGDSKLALRYFHLLSYFQRFPPQQPAQGPATSPGK